MQSFSDILPKIERACTDIRDPHIYPIRDVLDSIHKNIISITDNTLTFFHEEKPLYQTRCLTGQNGFWNEQNSGKTPPYLHVIVEKIGDNAPLGQKFEWRKPTQVIENPIPYGTFSPGVHTRILTLDGIQNKNHLSKERYIYIHGSIHRCFWETDNLRRTPGCIGLTPENMVELFDLVKNVKEQIFVYIEPSS